MDIEKAVAQVSKQGGAKGKGNQNRRRPKSAGSSTGTPRPASAQSQPTGLKISFKPAELNATTDKLVAQQV